MFMDRIIKTALFLLLVLVFTACATLAPVQADPVHLTIKDAGTTVTLRTGDNLTVELEGNPSTGYNWVPLSQDLKTLKLVGEPEAKPADSKLVGAPQTILLHFTATNPGQETLKLGYQRPWEKNVDPIKTYEVNIVVK